MQLKQNLELSKSVLRLTDDQRAMRTQIAELEDTVTSLNQQLLNAQEVSWCGVLYGRTGGGRSGGGSEIMNTAQQGHGRAVTLELRKYENGISLF